MHPTSRVRELRGLGSVPAPRTKTMTHTVGNITLGTVNSYGIVLRGIIHTLGYAATLLAKTKCMKTPC